METKSSDWGLGKTAPDLVLPAADGGSVRLESFRGRPLLLSFLSHAA